MKKHLVKRADYPDISTLQKRFQEEYRSLSQQLEERQSAFITTAQESLHAHGQWERPTQQEDLPDNSPVSTGSLYLASEVDVGAQLEDILKNPTTDPIPSFKDSAQDTQEDAPARVKLGEPLIIIMPGIGQTIITVTPEVLAAFQEVEQTQKALRELDTSWRQAIKESEDTYIDQEIEAMGAQGWLFAGLMVVGDTYASKDFFIFVKSDIQHTEPFTYKRVRCDLVLAELKDLKKNPEKWTQDPGIRPDIMYERRVQQGPQLFEEALSNVLSTQEDEGWRCLYVLPEALLFIRNVEQ